MSGRTERKIAWPLEPGAAPKINELVAGLIEEIDAVEPEAGGQIILVELGGEDAPEFLRLAERLTAAWEARGRDTLVVDAHPVEAFTADCYDDQPEGLTEIFHYGLSPEAAVRHRDGCAGLWIPAGGKWSLPLESPDEPQLTLFRLADLAEKVILLTDRNDAEGFLTAFRDPAHYRLILSPLGEAADLPELPTAEPIVVSGAGPEPEAEASPTSESETAKSPVPLVEERRKRGAKPLLILLPLLLLFWFFVLGPGRSQWEQESPQEFASGDSGFSHLPPPAELPFSAGGREEASGETSEPEEASSPRLGEGNYPIEAEAEPVAEKIESSAEAAPPVTVRQPDPQPVSTPAPVQAATSPRRRFESRELWARANRHGGPFTVHVESYRDSVLAADSARARGFAVPGFELRPQSVRGEIYYRLLVGPFGSLVEATAYRDSLLDHTDENYCTIAIEASE